MVATRGQTGTITRKDYRPKKNIDEPEEENPDGGELEQGTASNLNLKGTKKKGKLEAEGSNSPNHDDHVLPARKRAKKSSKGKKAKATSEDGSLPPPPGSSPFRGNRGKLMRVKDDFPLEVLDMILSYLPPPSLLALARTSKDFRDLLVVSMLVWKAAFENAGCPTKPDDLNYPEYAVLLYEAYCMHCSKRGSKKVDFMLRKRLCNDCWRNNIISRALIPYHDLDYFSELEAHIHYSRFDVWDWGYMNRDIDEVTSNEPEEDQVDRFVARCRYFYLPEVEVEHAKLAEMKKAIEIAKKEEDIAEEKQGQKGNINFKTERGAFLDEKGGVEPGEEEENSSDDEDVDMKGLDDKTDNSNESSYVPKVYFSPKVKEAEKVLEEWKQSKSDLFKKLRKHALLCNAWYRHHISVKATENMKTTLNRKEAIKEKLEALGWKDVDIMADRVQRSPYLKQTRELTDRIWSNIQNPLIETLVSVRADRIEAAKRTLWEDTIRNLEDRYHKFVESNLIPRSWPYKCPYFPSSSEILELPVLRELFERDPSEEDLEDFPSTRREIVTDEIWEGLILDEVWQEIEKWQKKVVRDLYEIIQKGFKEQVEMIEEESQEEIINEHQRLNDEDEDEDEDGIQNSNADVEGTTIVKKFSQNKDNDKDLDSDFDYSAAISYLLQHRCIFQCQDCRTTKTLTYPTLLSHCHVRPRESRTIKGRYGTTGTWAPVVIECHLDSLRLHQPLLQVVEKMLAFSNERKRERKVRLVSSREERLKILGLCRDGQYYSDDKKIEVVEEKDLEVEMMAFVCQDCPWKQKEDGVRVFTLREMLLHSFALHPLKKTPQQIVQTESFTAPPPLPLSRSAYKTNDIFTESNPYLDPHGIIKFDSNKKIRPELIKGKIFLDYPVRDEPIFLCAICQKKEAATGINWIGNFYQEMTRTIDCLDYSDIGYHFITEHGMEISVSENKDKVLVAVDKLASRYSYFDRVVADIYEKSKTTAA